MLKFLIKKRIEKEIIPENFIGIAFCQRCDFKKAIDTIVSIYYLQKYKKEGRVFVICAYKEGKPENRYLTTTSFKDVLEYFKNKEWIVIPEKFVKKEYL